MPDKISKRSRNIGSPPKTEGSKRRGRPPKVETLPLPPQETTVEPVNGRSDNAQLVPQQPVASQQFQSKAETYNGLTQIPHGLTIPSFDPNNHFASDLATDSSSLQVTSKVDADSIVQNIEGKRQTVRVMVANIGLNTDVVKAGNDFKKFEGAVIDYATTGVNNETKYVNYQVAGINKTIALNKLDQTNEKLFQGQAVLTGMRAITPLITEEWQARKSLKVSAINDLKTKAMRGSSQMDNQLEQQANQLPFDD